MSSSCVPQLKVLARGTDAVLETLPKLSSDHHSFLDHLKKINDTFYDQIRIADQKAAYIFTFMVAFLVTSAEGRAIFDPARYRSGASVEMVLSGVLAASVLISLVSAIMVVLPRNRTAGTSLYWGGWATNRNGFLAALGQDRPNYLFNEYLGNVDALAAINRTKYRFVALSFRGLMVTVVSYCFLLGWGTPAIIGA